MASACRKEFGFDSEALPDPGPYKKNQWLQRGRGPRLTKSRSIHPPAPLGTSRDQPHPPSLQRPLQGEMVRSRDEEPVCLKGLLLVLNAILTDKSELIIAGNSSSCMHFFQVVAQSPPRDLFSLCQRAALPSLSVLLTPKPCSASSF